MDEGFVRAQSDNLPKLSSMMLAVFFKNNVEFTNVETRGAKSERSERESYGDNALGYVQVKREGGCCIVKAKITPEHKLNSKAYSVCAVVDENSATVKSVSCEGCVAGLGGCKHAVAFLAWLHRRSEDPPVTSVRCYWKKSSLSTVKSAGSFKIADMLCKKVRALPPSDGTNRKAFLQSSSIIHVGDTQMTSYFSAASDLEKLSIDKMILEFQGTGVDTSDPKKFDSFCKSKITLPLCQKVERNTRSQSKTAAWHELRYGRVTASKLHAVAHCSTFDGSLVEQILGAKVWQNDAMKRGSELEATVRRVLEKELECKIQASGFLLNSDFPVFGASPDGVASDFIVEIKCPFSDATFKKYFENDGKTPSAKHFTQMQLQMYFANRSKGCFCVADPLFEVNKALHVSWVEFDEKYCQEMLCKAFNFWAKAVYPKLNA